MFLSFSYFFLFVLLPHLDFSNKLLFLWGHSAESELSSYVLSGGGRCLFYCGILEPQTARHWFRSATMLCHSANSVGTYYSEVPFSEFGPSSFVGIREAEDCRPSKSRFFLVLRLMASGRREMSIEEIDDYNASRRAERSAT
jgi:hypothetical protein